MRLATLTQSAHHAQLEPSSKERPVLPRVPCQPPLEKPLLDNVSPVTQLVRLALDQQTVIVQSARVVIIFNKQKTPV